MRKYAILAQKISSLVLRERELDSIDYDRKGKINYILHSIFEDKNINYLALTEFFESNKLKMDDEYRVIIVRAEQSGKMRDTAAVENWVNTCFSIYGNALYTFVYPSEFWLVVTDKQYRSKKNVISDLISYDGCRLIVSVGRKTSAKKLNISYHSAQTALKSTDEENRIVCYDDLTLEILFGELSQGEKKSFSDKILHNLSKDEIGLLKLYYAEDMSLSAVAEKRFMHKNTLQYKLNKIEENAVSIRGRLRTPCFCSLLARCTTKKRGRVNRFKFVWICQTEEVCISIIQAVISRGIFPRPPRKSVST